MSTQAAKTIWGRRRENPRTILAFLATVLAITVVGITSVVGILAYRSVSVWLIPWLLGFAGFLIVALLVTVIAMTYHDPSKLMLGQVTGHEYMEIQRVNNAPLVASEVMQRRLDEATRDVVGQLGPARDEAQQHDG